MSNHQIDANTKQTDANTLRQQAETVRLLVDIGYDKQTAVKAVTSNDLSVLNA